MGTGQRVGDAVVGWSQACSRDRSAARSYLFRMVRDVQAGAALTAADIQAFVRDADDRGWPEVARAALMLDVVRSRAETGGYAPVAVGQLLDRAIADRDLVMTAMGLAMGAHDPGDSGTRSAAVADQDLARAAVLLESAPDRTLEFASAHLDCAMAYGYRNLWELELLDAARRRPPARRGDPHPDRSRAVGSAQPRPGGDRQRRRGNGRSLCVRENGGRRRRCSL